MNTKIKTKIILAAMALCAFTGFTGTETQAADKWKVTEISDFYNESESGDEQYMNSTKDGSVQYITTAETYLETKKDRLYSLFSRKTIGDKKIEKIEQFKGNFASDTAYYYDHTDFTKAFDDCTVIINYRSHKKSASIQINRYDANGKQRLKYTDKVNLKSKYTDLIIDDVMIKGNKIYYCYHERNKPEILNVRYINKNIKKNQKAKESCTITINNGFARARLENNCIYILQSEQIGKYSLKGKQTDTYTLPEGEKQLFTKLSPDTYETGLATMTIDNFCVYKNNVFYCNVNGIYKLTKNKKPKLIYNAKNDNFFAGEYGVKDICAGDNNTFYLMFDNIRNYEVCVYDWAYKLVKYSK